MKAKSELFQLLTTLSSRTHIFPSSLGSWFFGSPSLSLSFSLLPCAANSEEVTQFEKMQLRLFFLAQWYRQRRHLYEEDDEQGLQSQGDGQERKVKKQPDLNNRRLVTNLTHERSQHRPPLLLQTLTKRLMRIPISLPLTSCQILVFTCPSAMPYDKGQ